ncbi:MULTISPECIES: transposase [unclassified Pseudomonas]|uniref:transposase n=1 Tax=unclassified Pseudomonas TaxID=196821 RepID=UPI000C87DE8F|nr:MULTISPECIES: transposase [unclassified Pseudomonas]PMZ96080.1 transposase [Pseudomonas sp. FW305-42]PNA24420.1 transposase [Pseudomonas sp. MPR-R1B]PNB25127.1 transposase [Pseudomonas sp. DP16D-E2]PNB42511.1 transposase [Pseudomonas sp. FW305-17]PNB59340.1 transposase [Pseudomonas sp. GW531-E2]
MPRGGRVLLPHCPHHIVHRGHNRQVVFAQDTDFQRYLADLRELKDAFGVKVYAYCLMTNHVHILLVPDDACAGLSQLMKTLAARATRYRNRLEGRSGTLWESRFKSSIVQSDTYLLACCRYIELNPIRARMAVEAGDYPWSSYSIRMGAAKRQNWLDDNPLFEALGETEELRRKRYAEFVRQAISDEELSLIRDAIQRGQLTGSSRFVDEIAQITGKRIERRKQGRPKLE